MACAKDPPPLGECKLATTVVDEPHQSGPADAVTSYQFSGKYALRQFLGEGRYGSVWRCKERGTGRYFALKFIDLEACSPRARASALREVAILKKLAAHRRTTAESPLSSPSGRGASANASGSGSGAAAASDEQDFVVSLRDVYADDRSLFLVLDLCTGGDLLSLIDRQPESRLPEDDARHIFACVARGVQQCHDSGIVHRDIKPENILLCRPPPQRRGVSSTSSSPRGGAPSLSSPAPAPFSYAAKLADFGLAVEAPQSSARGVRGYAGSAPYEAPEVVADRSYGQSADVWSLGVTLYAMLSGMWPAFVDGERALDERVDWDLPSWDEVSPQAKDLICWMLTVDKHRRPTIEQVLAHPWVACAAVAVGGPPVSPFTSRRGSSRCNNKSSFGEARRSETVPGTTTVVAAPSSARIDGSGSVGGSAAAASLSSPCVSSVSASNLVCRSHGGAYGGVGSGRPDADADLNGQTIPGESRRGGSSRQENGDAVFLTTVPAPKRPSKAFPALLALDLAV